MKILFCSEGFLIDGVASFNLYLSAALVKAGHDVAIVGRWAGFKSFKKRHIESGVKVIDNVSVVPDSKRLIEKALAFNPDILVTDSRRAFPLAIKIKQRSNAKLVTVFHDSIWDKPQKKNREIETIKRFSDGWVTSEKNIFRQMQDLHPQCPSMIIRRPISDMVVSSPLVSRDPFKVLCLGRLSGYKSPGFKAILENALELKNIVPSLQITFVGGGSRLPLFKSIAFKINRRTGENFVSIAGTLVDPNPLLQWSTVVCAGATSAIEGLLSNRPVIAFSGFWMGLVCPDTLQYGIDTHFGERSGDMLMREHPRKSVEELIRVYNEWDQLNLVADTKIMQQRLEEIFSSCKISDSFLKLFQNLRNE